MSHDRRLVEEVCPQLHERYFIDKGKIYCNEHLPDFFHQVEAASEQQHLNVQKLRIAAKNA